MSTGSAFWSNRAIEPNETSTDSPKVSSITFGATGTTELAVGLVLSNCA